MILIYQGCFVESQFGATTSGLEDRIGDTGNKSLYRKHFEGETTLSIVYETNQCYYSMDSYKM